MPETTTQEVLQAVAVIGPVLDREAYLNSLRFLRDNSGYQLVTDGSKLGVLFAASSSIPKGYESVPPEGWFPVPLNLIPQPNWQKLKAMLNNIQEFKVPSDSMGLLTVTRLENAIAGTDMAAIDTYLPMFLKGAGLDKDEETLEYLYNINFYCMHL